MPGGRHLGGLAFAFTLVVVMLLLQRPVPLLAVLALGVLVLSPYLRHEALCEWPNLRAFVSVAGQEAGLDLQALRMAAMSTSFSRYRSSDGRETQLSARGGRRERCLPSVSGIRERSVVRYSHQAKAISR